jgi:hypothetical protein
MAHWAYVYVIDPKGQLQQLFPFGMSLEKMADEIWSWGSRCRVNHRCAVDRGTSEHALVT